MAKKDDGPDAGEQVLDDLTAGKAGLEAISDEQMQYLGGDRDPIDSENFEDADFGNDLPEGFDDRSPELAQASAKDDDDDDADKDDKPTEDEPDADDADPKTDDDADDSDDKGDDDKGDDGDPDDKGDDDADKGEDGDEPKSGEDADADAKGDGEDKGDPEEPEKKPREQQIPKSRFDKVNQRRRDAEAEVARLKAEKDAGDQAEAFDFDAAEKIYLDLALAGKVDKALEKRQEIRAAEAAVYSQQATVTAVDATKDGQDQIQLDGLVTKYEKEYPGMNPDSETYNEDLMDEVTAQYVGYQSLGFERPEAFKMACDNVVKIYELESTTGEPTTDKAEKKPAAKKKVPIKKTKEKLAKAKDQPADPSKVGTGASDDVNRPALDIDNMSDEDLAALPSATLARLRGDTL